MAFWLSLGMVGSGAVVALILTAWFRRNRRIADEESSRSMPLRRESVPGTILYAIARSGGLADAEARDVVTAVAGELPITGSAVVDVGRWAHEFRRFEPARTEWLLDAAVRVAVHRSASLTLRQYEALLAVTFGLGFQTDALTRARLLHPFTWRDRAAERPAWADHRRPARERRATLARSLGLDPARAGERHEVVAAYRKVVAECHPDRFFSEPEADQAAAAERFIRLTEAYEELLALCDD